ncbi:MAG: Cyclase family protein, partial [uncultured Rubrobacteraceae bacterium]
AGWGEARIRPGATAYRTDAHPPGPQAGRLLLPPSPPPRRRVSSRRNRTPHGGRGRPDLRRAHGYPHGRPLPPSGRPHPLRRRSGGGGAVLARLHEARRRGDTARSSPRRAPRRGRERRRRISRTRPRRYGRGSRGVLRNAGGRRRGGERGARTARQRPLLGRRGALPGRTRHGRERGVLDGGAGRVRGWGRQHGLGRARVGRSRTRVPHGWTPDPTCEERYLHHREPRPRRTRRLRTLPLRVRLHALEARRGDGLPRQAPGNGIRV